MPRRKKKFLMLKGKHTGNLIVVSRHWYDNVHTPGSLGGMRYDRRWKIMAQHDDESVLITMADLTDNHLRTRVDHTHEDEKGNITNVRS
jgi:hypothetical protein